MKQGIIVYVVRASNLNKPRKISIFQCKFEREWPDGIVTVTRIKKPSITWGIKPDCIFLSKTDAQAYLESFLKEQLEHAGEIE